jgi:hypothetical protein
MEVVPVCVREAKRAQQPTCMRRRMCTAAAGGVKLAGATVVARADNSSSARTGAAAVCLRAGRLHACAVDPPRQSGRAEV